MSDDATSGSSPEESPAEHDTHEPATSRARIDRARLARVFGDVLPSTTRDERSTGGARGADAEDEWLRSQKPPHHG
ncbi:hypothetical protein [Rhodococcus rhodnii]|uniref:Uncharacterized protein n=2 Tax=Rhodococcus rhodnii TaxID=38312 RepID=R7WQR5_9NOCA|nr:hypothetical protein [Rhodococcus rhodnii]EOM77630.1 hypothetical protein Rrhod_1041 [Rhodococcus rhodnii LMG 5362]